MKSGQNKRKTQTKKREKGWELDFPAALSSAQQHSAVLNLQQFQGFLTFCRVRVEKVRTKPKKSTKSIKQIGETMNSGQNKRKTQTKKKGKRMGIGFPSSTQQHSATLSSTQQCSICNQFQGFLTFSRVRDEKGENEAKKNAKSIQTIWKKQ